MLTGFTLFSLLGIPLLILVLLSITTVFIKRTFRNEAILLLLIVNGLLMVKYLWLYFTDTVTMLPSEFESVFNSIEFILLLLILRLVSNRVMTRQAINYFLVVYLSVVFTLYFTNQILPFEPVKKILEAAVLLLLSALCLYRLINEKSIFILYSPLFWIAAGTGIYYCMSLGIEALSLGGYLNQERAEKEILLLVFNLVRHLFYTIACFKQDKPEKELRLFKESTREYPL